MRTCDCRAWVLKHLLQVKQVIDEICLVPWSRVAPATIVWSIGLRGSSEASQLLLHSNGAILLQGNNIVTDLTTTRDAVA